MLILITNYILIDVDKSKRSGTDTIKYHTWPWTQYGKVTNHKKTSYTRGPRRQPFPNRWPQKLISSYCRLSEIMCLKSDQLESLLIVFNQFQFLSIEWGQVFDMAIPCHIHYCLG